MSVARIITRSPELSEGLAHELRARGYCVEMVAPEQAGGSPAELEIIFHTYALPEALGRAAELAQAAEADVYIARGVYGTAEPVPLENGSAPVSASHAVDDEAGRAQAAVASVTSPEPVQPPLPHEAESERHSVIRDMTALGDRATRRLVERWGTVVSAAGRQTKSLASGLGTSISEWRGARRQRREQAQQQQLHRQQKRRREREEQERRQAGVPRVQPSPRAARARRGNVLRDTVGAFGRAAGNFAGQLGEAVFTLTHRVDEWRTERRQRALAEVPRLRRRAADRLPVIRRTRERDSEWKTAAVVSVLLAVAVMVAWEAANRRPASPLPDSVLLKSNSMEQQIPFGPVTLRAPAAPTKRLKPSPQKFSQAKTAPSRLSAAAPAQHVHESEDTEDVVIRHFAPAGASDPAAKSGGSVRRYTDE